MSRMLVSKVYHNSAALLLIQLRTNPVIGKQCGVGFTDLNSQGGGGVSCCSSSPAHSNFSVFQFVIVGNYLGYTMAVKKSDIF